MVESVQPSCSDDARGTVRILLVDDNPANLLALEAVLEPLGQELMRASSGADALEQLNRHDFALVLMDVSMPLLDGFQTVEAIRRRKELEHMPVMFLTALFKDEVSARRGYELGAVDFIMKPFEPAIVRSKVAAFVSLYLHNERVRRQQRQIAEEMAGRAAAERAQKTLEEFVAILGHDLRNPLNAILVTAHQHGRASTALDSCRSSSRVIGNAVVRMSDLVSDVVDLARSRLAGGIPVERKPANMGELCRAAVDELYAGNPRREMVVRVDGDVNGQWDPQRVVQAIGNVVGNAIDHGSQDGAIELFVHGNETEVVLEVHNFGAAIPAAKLQHLFEPFYRDGERHDGLGLGLYIAYQIVCAHGGTIAVSSAESAGTRFTLRWPRHDRSEPPSPA